MEHIVILTSEQLETLSAAGQKMAGLASSAAELGKAIDVTRDKLREVIHAGFVAGMDLKAPGAELPDQPPVTPDPEPIDDADEGPIFEEGGHYAWLPDSYMIDDAPAWMHELLGSDKAGVAPLRLDVNDPRLVEQGPLSAIPRDNFKSVVPFNLPEEASHLRARCVSAAQPWGEQGPTWFMRNFEVQGELSDIVLWRPGDFGNGREGHCFYFNVRGDLHMHDIIAVQHGAQAMQLVWRTNSIGETGTINDPEAWPEAQSPPVNILVERFASIDGGVIDERPGVPLQAVRASWPFTVFTTGHNSVTMRDLFIRTNLPVPFKGEFRSHGAIVAAPGKRKVMSNLLILEDLDVELHASDRSIIRCGAFREVEIRSGYMREFDTPNTSRIALDATVDVVRIGADLDWSGVVEVFHPDDAYKGKLASFDHKAGAVTEIQPSSFL